LISQFNFMERDLLREIELVIKVAVRGSECITERQRRIRRANRSHAKGQRVCVGDADGQTTSTKHQ